MSEREKPTVNTTHWTTGAWVDAGKTPGTPPHTAPGDERARLDIVWGDAERTVPVAVRDYDGCEAVIAGQALE